MSERTRLLKLLQVNTELQKQLKKSADKYIKEKGQLLYYSDHAIVRYIERVLNQTTIEGTDEEKVATYLAENKLKGDKLREGILTPLQKKVILLLQLKRYVTDEHIYVIRDLTVITILNKEEQ